MKTKTQAFNADELVRCVEDVRGAVTGRRKITLRTTTLPKPAPAIGPRDVKRLRCRLKMSQPGFAAVLNIPLVTATSWEKGTPPTFGRSLATARDCQAPPRSPHCRLTSAPRHAVLASP